MPACDVCGRTRSGGWTVREVYPGVVRCREHSHLEPDYVVLRWPRTPYVWRLEGVWFDRSTMPTTHPMTGMTPIKFVPTGRFEFRDGDGACAEVWEPEGPT